jgi:hypothetical protein
LVCRRRLAASFCLHRGAIGRPVFGQSAQSPPLQRAESEGADRCYLIGRRLAHSMEAAAMIRITVMLEDAKPQLQEEPTDV